MTLTTDVQSRLLALERDIAAMRPNGVGLYVAHTHCRRDHCDLEIMKVAGPDFEDIADDDLEEFVATMPPLSRCLQGLGISFWRKGFRYFAMVLQGGTAIVIQRNHGETSWWNAKPRCFVVPNDRLMVGEAAEIVMALRSVVGAVEEEPEPDVPPFIRALMDSGAIVVPIDMRRFLGGPDGD